MKEKKQLIIMKFGGTSVADAEKIKKVADKAIAAKLAGKNVLIVVSAMGNTTDR